MSHHKVEDIRNIVLCGHGSAGKTTLVDKLLVKTGAVASTGTVDDGTSFCDFDDEEREHHYSVESKVVHFDHRGKRINLIDTPGYPDFIGQTIGALHGGDTAAVVINAHVGIGVNTRRVFAEAGKLGLGRMIIINMMDLDNIDFPALVADLQEIFGTACVPLNVPVGCSANFRGVISTLEPPERTDGALIDPEAMHEKLVEAIVESDEVWTERYLEGEEPRGEELRRLLIDAVAHGHVIPIVCVSSKKEIGLEDLLDSFVDYCLSPDMVPHKVLATDGHEILLDSSEDSPLVAQVFKTRIDPFVQKLSFVRVFSGKLRKDDSIHASGSRKNIKIHQLLDMQAGQAEAIDEAGPGDIVAIAKIEDLHSGTTLGDYELPEFEFPQPMVGLAVSPRSRGDESKLSTALHKIVEEDPTVHLDRDPQTKELVMTGMSELHLQLIQQRLKRRDHVEVETHEPKIPYRETIQVPAAGSYRHKKQSGGRGQFGEVHIRMVPLPAGTDIESFVSKEQFPHARDMHYDAEHNFLWIDSIVGGTIPNNFLPAVEKGFKERLDRGVLAGCRIENVCVEVHYGKHHPVDSSEAAFKTAASLAFRDVFLQGSPALLEPIVRLEITAPMNSLGDISSDLSGRRGRVLGMDAAGGDLQLLAAEAPLAEVATYARQLSSVTGGRGSFTMQFSHYDVVPAHKQQEIIKHSVLTEDEDAA